MSSNASSPKSLSSHGSDSGSELFPTSCSSGLMIQNPSPIEFLLDSMTLNHSYCDDSLKSQTSAICTPTSFGSGTAKTIDVTLSATSYGLSERGPHNEDMCQNDYRRSEIMKGGCFSPFQGSIPRGVSNQSTFTEGFLFSRRSDIPSEYPEPQRYFLQSFGSSTSVPSSNQSHRNYEPRRPSGFSHGYMYPGVGGELAQLHSTRIPQNPRSKNSSHYHKGSSPSVDGYVYQVRFKRAHKTFILAPSAPRDIFPGDFVKVEADRGEDLGVVLSKIPVDQYEEPLPTAGYRGRGFATGQGERKLIYRHASAEERHMLQYKLSDEEVAFQDIVQKSKERGLPMVVLDAEYQYDRHKLTFYFEADRRIDFRDLVSDLFSYYKTRIWMQQVDTSTLDPADPGDELARAAGFLSLEREDYSSGRSSLSSGIGREEQTIGTSVASGWIHESPSSFGSRRSGCGRWPIEPIERY